MFILKKYSIFLFIIYLITAYSGISKNLSVTQNNNTALYHLGIYYLDNHEFDKSAVLFQKLVNIEPKNYNYQMKYAESLYMTGQINQAVKHYLNVIILKPELKYKIFYIIGKIFLNEDQPVESLDYLKKAYNKEFLNNPEYLFDLGNSYFINNNFKQSIFYFEKCKNYIKNNSSLLFNLALSYYMEKEYDNAEKNLKSVLQNNPEYFKANILLIKIYSLKNELENHTNLFDNFLFNYLDKKNKETFYNLTELAVFLTKNKDYKFAEIILKKISETFNNIKINLMLSKLYYQNEKYDESLEIFNEILKHKIPDTLKTQIYVLSGIIYLQKSAYIKSIDYLKKAKKIYPKFELTHIILSNAYYKNKQENKAVKTLETAINKYNLNSYDILITLSYYYSEQNNTDKLFESYKKIIELYPDKVTPTIYNFVGYSYLEKNINFDTAYKYITNALEKEPDNPYYLDSIAWYYYLKQDFNKSKEYFEKIDMNNINDYIIFEHYGDLFIKLNQPDKAIKWYKKAYQLKQTDTLKKKMDKLIK